MSSYDYLDQLIKNAEALERSPASIKPFIGPPLEFSGVDKQPELQIVAETIKPLEYNEGYKPQLKQSDLYISNLNKAIEQRQAQANAYTQNALDLSEENRRRMVDFDTALRSLSSGLDQYKRPENLDFAIKKAEKEASDLKQPESRNLFSELLISFAPAVAGAIGGESAAIAAPTAGKQARDIYETQRKEEIDLFKEKNKQALEKYEKLLKIDQKAAEEFLQRQKLNVDMGRAQIEGLKFATTTTAKDLESAQQLAEKANKQVTDVTAAGAKNLVDLESIPAKEEEKTKRAKIISGIQSANKPPTEFQGKSAMYYNLTAQAQQNINDLVAKNKGYPSLDSSFFRTKKEILSGKYGDISVSDFINKYIDDPNLRAQAQAEIQFLEGIGRISSGAAINASEWLQFREQYFPTYGDKEDSIAFKEKQRQTMVKSMKSNAGKAPTIEPQSVITKPKLSEKDQQALDWAKKNAKDPRAQKTLQTLGVK